MQAVYCKMPISQCTTRVGEKQIQEIRPRASDGRIVESTNIAAAKRRGSMSRLRPCTITLHTSAAEHRTQHFCHFPGCSGLSS